LNVKDHIESGSTELYVPTRERGKVGRPKGSRSRMLDLTHKLLSTNGEKVVRKIIEIALEDGNPNQLQALKMCVDRIAPTSFFEDLTKSGAGTAVNIQVNLVQPDAGVPKVETTVVDAVVVDEKTSS